MGRTGLLPESPYTDLTLIMETKNKIYKKIKRKRVPNKMSKNINKNSNKKLKSKCKIKTTNDFRKAKTTNFSDMTQ